MSLKNNFKLLWSLFLNVILYKLNADFQIGLKSIYHIMVK